jgi:hypothetical protein
VQGLLRTTFALALVLAVVPPAALANHRVLATGDSMIQLVDHALADRLAPDRFKVKSDAHVGTGLSKPFLIDWPRHAKHVAATYKPRASVVFLGANEGFPIRYHGEKVNCCSRRWSQAYAARAERMMRALEREGHGRVYWLTLPAARPHNWNRIYRRVNAGIEIAAAAERANGVRLVDMRRVFTPNGHFQSSIRRGGRRVTVRQSDGIHLNVRGASIAARVVARAMRRDGLLG